MSEHLLDLLITRIHRVNGNSGHADAGIQVDFLRDPPGQEIDLCRGHRVRDLHVNGTDQLIRAVVVDDQIIRSSHFRESEDRLLHLGRGLTLHPLADDLTHSILKHFDA